MKPPIIIDENGNVMFFNSVESAENYLEPIDIKRNEYIAYDSRGNLLGLSVVKKKGKFLGFIPTSFEWVQIQEIKPRTNCRKELHSKLIGFMDRSGIDKKLLKTMSFSKLVDLGIEKYKT